MQQSGESADKGKRARGGQFFRLIADVEDIAFDLSVSKEASPSALRSIKGATLPALLRRLTSIETTTQSQILAFLLNMKDIECGSLELIQFLHARFTLSKSKVDRYAASVRCEMVNPEVADELIDYKVCCEAHIESYDSGHKSESNWLLEDRAVIGSQFYWLCSATELDLHNGDRIAEDAALMMVQNCISNMEDMVQEINSSHTENNASPCSFCTLSALISVQVGVLLFLETWLNQVPEDFLLCAATCNNEPVSFRLSGVGSDVLDALIDFLWDFCQDSTLNYFGLKHSAEKDNEQKRLWPKSVEILPNSLLARQFPCISKLLNLLCVKLNAATEVEFTKAVSNQNVSIMEKERCVTDSPNHDENRNLSADSPSLPLIGNDKPLTLNPSDNDRRYYRQRIEQVMNGEISDRESLTSLRLSFFDKFGEDSLSEILEFESEIISQSQGPAKDYRPESWNVQTPTANRFENSTTATTATTAAESLKVWDLNSFKAAIEIQDSIAEGNFNSTHTIDNMDSFSFFKSLFKSQEERHDDDLNSKDESNFSISDTTRPRNHSDNSGLLAEDSHVISLSTILNKSLGDVCSVLLVPNQVIQSAITAASMGIRMSTLISSQERAINEPFQNVIDEGSFKSSGVLSGAKSQGNIVHVNKNFGQSLRKLFVSTLAKLNEDNFSSCTEMYSYFGMMLSAVELRTAQDYVDSNDMTQDDVPSRLFIDPIDRYIIKYNSTDALCSEKISYLVKSSREESELLPVENREMSPPSVDRVRSSVSPTHPSSDSSSGYLYDADYNNSSSAADQQTKRNRHRKEQRRRTITSITGQNSSQHRSGKAESRRHSILTPETNRRVVGSKKSSSSFRSSLSSGSLPSSSSVRGSRSSFSMSSRGSAYSMSDALFGHSKVYIGPSLFLDYTIYQVAANLTMRLHYMYCTIPILEFVVDYVYAYDSKSNMKNRTPMLTRFRKESEKLQRLFIGEVLVHPDVSTRAEVIIKMIKVAEYLARIRSHHALMLVVYALHSHAIFRLKSTWAVVHAKLPGRWDILCELVGFGGNKLVSFFCQRQPRNGISPDCRTDMHLDVRIPESCCEVCEDTASIEKSNDCQVTSLEKDASKAVKVALSPKRRAQMYSSDSNSSYGFTESCGEECQDQSSKSDNFCKDLSASLARQIVHPKNDNAEVALCSSLSRCVPFTLTVVNSDKYKSDDDDTSSTRNSSSLCFRLGFQIMTSGQDTPSGSIGLVSSAVTSSYGSVLSRDEKISHGDDSGEHPPLVEEAVQRVESSDNLWRVENSTTTVQSDTDKDNSSVNEDGVVHKIIDDNGKNESQSETTGSVVLPDKFSPADFEENASDSYQTVDMLVSLTDRDRSENRGPIRPPQSFSYRRWQVSNLSLRPPKSGLGEVRSDGLTSSNAFSGLPMAARKPFMPFLNGLLQKIIRLNELPNFLRSQSSTPTTPLEKQKKNLENGYLWVRSPGNSSTDPRLLMINFGKYRSISNILMLIRSSQLTPFSLHVDFVVQAMLYRDAMYKTEDDIWDRSSELE